MLQGWVVIAVALAYIGLLFLVASYGDRTRRLGPRAAARRLLIYPLSLAIYCTSWTFFGSVGSASRTGYEFLTIYIGPVLMIGLFSPLLLRIVRLAKAQNITSIADFIAARYGKGQAVAATVALIAIVGTIPYIALQLKAVSSSLETILAHIAPAGDVRGRCSATSRLFVALSMATFAVLFGTRHIDATEHQDGLMLAIATESIVKLFAFLGGRHLRDVLDVRRARRAVRRGAATTADRRACSRASRHSTRSIATTLLSFVAILLLPRQFHVAVVENNNEGEIKRAAWLFPLYLVLINLFVVPIALAGLLTFPAGTVDSDMFVLALPLHAGSNMLTIAAFVGGLSAATAMVIVELVALSIMVSNDLDHAAGAAAARGADQRPRECRLAAADGAAAGDLRHPAARLYVLPLGRRCAARRRSACCPSRPSRNWRRRFSAACSGGAPPPRGAIAGMSAGILVWAYTLLLPSFADIGFIGQHILTEGRGASTMLRPQHLFGLDLPPLVHGVVWSLTHQYRRLYRLLVAPRAVADRAAAGQYCSCRRNSTPIAPSFRLWRSSVTVEELTSTVARYLGEERTRNAFDELRRHPPHQPRAQGRGRFPAGAPCRAHSRLGDRRARRRGWCCRCCCASARSRPRRR